MSTRNLARGAAAAFAAAVLAAPFPACAEKADKDKPTRIEANRMSADDARRITIFEGNVILAKGTILVRADRIVVRQDNEGFQITHCDGRAGALPPEREAATSGLKARRCASKSTIRTKK